MFRLVSICALVCRFVGDLVVLFMLLIFLVLCCSLQENASVRYLLWSAEA